MELSPRMESRHMFHAKNNSSISKREILVIIIGSLFVLFGFFFSLKYSESSASIRVNSRPPVLSGPALSTKGPIFIAINLHQNEPILPQMMASLLDFSGRVGKNRVFISIFENGSTDKTKDYLIDFKSELVKQDIAHKIVSKSVSWRSFCSSARLSPYLQEICMSPEATKCRTLRSCPQNIRIPLMALFRNMALLPFYGVETIDELYRVHDGKLKLNATMDMSHLGLSNTLLPTPMISKSLSSSFREGTVLFINDVLFSANELIALVDTPVDYDMACALDFEELKFYDVWVTRDIEGFRFSDWYPYARRKSDSLAVLEGRPFQVFSCWNGGVAMKASSLLAGKLTLFRSWKEGEPRSPHPLALTDPGNRFTRSCAASECALVCNDLWEKGFYKIYINPRVRFFYNDKSRRLHDFMSRFINPALWSVKSLGASLGSMFQSQREHTIKINPPIAVECGTNA